MFYGSERSETETAAITPEMMAAMLDYMPLRSLMSFGGVNPDEIRKLVDQMNQL
jgi:hypothetical protein